MENLKIVIRANNDDASFEDIYPVGANADEAKEQIDMNEDEDDAVRFLHSVLPSAALIKPNRKTKTS